jgi:glycosyltransferase involved in cell wall biosynthesis
MAHNYYTQSGGEDNVFFFEKNLLHSKGHEVYEYTDTNSRLNTFGVLYAAKNTIWSSASYQSIKELIKKISPDIVHFHNTFLMLSPSVYYACWEMHVPVVQSLHNYRIACPSATFFRNNHGCEDCIDWKIPLPGVLHKCYRNSYTQTTIVAAMLSFHRFRKTWQEKVSAYIVGSNFARKKIARAGLPLDRLHLKPNLVDVSPRPPAMIGEYAIIFGRLSQDKGIVTVINAWKSIRNVPLIITGDGEMKEFVQNAAAENPSIDYRGFTDRDSLFHLIKGARFIVMASMMYEVFPMTLLEAFACGVPIIASRGGAIPEIVKDGITGLLFDPNNPVDLAEKSQWLWNHPEEAVRMGVNARHEFEEKYTPEKNYQLLINIYRIASNIKL